MESSGTKTATKAGPELTEGSVGFGSLVRGLVLLTALLIGVFPLFGWWGVRWHGREGVWAALLSLGLCWGGGVLGMLAASLFRGGQAANGVLLGMVVRMMLPLLVALALTAGGSPLAGAGLMGMLTVYYLIALTFETIWSVRMIRAAQSVSKVL